MLFACLQASLIYIPDFKGFEVKVHIYLPWYLSLSHTFVNKTDKYILINSNRLDTLLALNSLMI